MEQTDQALKFVVSLEKTIKRICQDRQCDLSQNEQATLKTFLRNFCEENEVKAFLYLRLFLVCQVDPKREELYDRLVRLLIKLSNTSAETEVWTLQEILDNKKNTEIDQKERDATFQIILQDSIELIKKMLQAGILNSSQYDLRYLSIKLKLRCHNPDQKELANQCIDLADDLLSPRNDDELLPMIKNLLVVSECLFPDFSDRLLSRWPQWVWHLFQPPALEWDHSKVGMKRLLGDADLINCFQMPTSSEISETCRIKWDFAMIKPISSYDQARMIAEIFLNPTNVTEKILAHLACLDGRRGTANKWKRQSKWHRKRFLKARELIKETSQSNEIRFQNLLTLGSICLSMLNIKTKSFEG